MESTLNWLELNIDTLSSVELLTAEVNLYYWTEPNQKTELTGAE